MLRDAHHVELIKTSHQSLWIISLKAPCPSRLVHLPLRQTWKNCMNHGVKHNEAVFIVVKHPDHIEHYSHDQKRCQRRKYQHMRYPAPNFDKISSVNLPKAQNVGFSQCVFWKFFVHSLCKWMCHPISCMGIRQLLKYPQFFDPNCYLRELPI